MSEELARDLRQCRFALQCQVTDTKRAQRALTAAWAREDALSGQIDALLARVEELGLALAGRDAEISGLQLTLSETRATFQHDLARRDAMLASLTATVAVLEAHRDEAAALRRSTSWRVTRPLRAIRNPGLAAKELLRRARGG